MKKDVRQIEELESDVVDKGWSTFRVRFEVEVTEFDDLSQGCFRQGTKPREQHSNPNPEDKVPTALNLYNNDDDGNFHQYTWVTEE